MCVSNHFIEQQAYKMTEVIKGNTLYKFVGVDFSGGEGAGFQKLVVHENEHHDTPASGTALITKVLLQDKDGSLYSVEPNLNGLRFAKGEISYKKYQKLQRKNDLTMFLCFYGIIGFFIVSMIIVGNLI
ncbi:hypothetical protein [Neobacillus sp. FSL H8-0543]|uniref:hypothetical protein n=1 Tax=Neobacillus sp. FSL H8-0543 TaxID=2954672 RepID=UPI0031586763